MFQKKNLMNNLDWNCPICPILDNPIPKPVKTFFQQLQLVKKSVSPNMNAKNLFNDYITHVLPLNNHVVEGGYRFPSAVTKEDVGNHLKLCENSFNRNLHAMMIDCQQFSKKLKNEREEAFQNNDGDEESERLQRIAEIQKIKESNTREMKFLYTMFKE